MSNSKQLKRQLTKARTREELEKEVAEEKAKRQTKCSDEVNAVLGRHNCGLSTMVQVSSTTAKPLDEVLALPSQVIVLSK